MKKNNNFSWRKYADRIYGINRAKELADKMIKEFPKGGSVYLDDYTEEEVEEARKIYNERKKHIPPKEIESEIKGIWNGRKK
jgi:spore coat protein CotH|tara:strand:- start:100 stop:345 length:246 start_codon:yes stop_codon:yes gene_type:complete